MPIAIVKELPASFKGDKVEETKHYLDQMTMLAQIGGLSCRRRLTAELA